MQDLVDAGSCSQPPSGKDYRGGEAQIAGEARKARRRNDLQNVICQLLPAPSNLPLWLCLASYVEKILIRAVAFRQAFIICSAFEDFISHVCQLCNRGPVQFSSSTNIYCKQQSLFWVQKLFLLRKPDNEV